MGSSPKSYSWLLEKIESEWGTFSDAKTPLLSYQASSFRACYNLLRENEVSLSERSKQRRSERLRARNFLADIFIGVSPEVFFLCIITIPITKLEKISPKDTIPKLRAWWKAIPHPHGLTAIVTELCDKYSIHSLISSYQQHQLPETSIEAGYLSPAFPTTTESSGNDIDNIPVQDCAHNPKMGRVYKRRRVADDSLAEQPTLIPPQLPVNLALPSQGEYCSFSFMSREKVELIPEPFRTALKTSQHWREENDTGGLAVTNCVTIFLPEVCNEDSFFLIRMGYERGFQISNYLGLGDEMNTKRTAT